MTYVDDLEKVVEEVSDWALEQVDLVLDALSPDGRPFGMEELSMEQQAADYMNIVGQPEAWAQWITDKAQVIITRLEGVAVDPLDIQTIQPFKIATMMAMDYSARMEAYLAKGIPDA